MKIHAVHTKLVETQDLLDMLAVFPDRAEHGDFYLFGRPHHDPQQPVVDLTRTENLEEFEQTYLSLMQEEHVGRWIYINNIHAMFLLKKYYTQEETRLE